MVKLIFIANISTVLLLISIISFLLFKTINWLISIIYKRDNFHFDGNWVVNWLAKDAVNNAVNNVVNSTVDNLVNDLKKASKKIWIVFNVSAISCLVFIIIFIVLSKQTL